MRIPLHLLSLLLALLIGPVARAQTGHAVPEMAHYDTFIQNFLTQYNIPGAAVAVAKDGRLVYARGFGLADVVAGEPVQPDSRFRIASVSKPITGVVAMRLVEEGRLDLDAPAFAFLDHLPAPEAQTEDSRLADITVRDLLQHSAGWDRDGTGYDPMFDVVRIADEMGVARPADCETVIRYMRGRPLDFNPGARHAYSNLGYCVLGRILEMVAGDDYEDYVQAILAEAGIENMALGASRLEDRLPDEVRYYPPTPTTASVFDGTQVPWPYGGFYLEAMDAHGGWVASAPDLLRFTAALDGQPNRPDLLSTESMAVMTARPDVPTWNATNWWYGLGWAVNTNGHWWHLGSLPGSESLLVRSSYLGLHWAVLLNARTPQSATYMAALDNGMWNQAMAVTSWPTHDLFESGTASEPGLERPGLALTIYPNPADRAATLRLSEPVGGEVRIEVWDVLGRRVAVLQDGALASGTHDLTLDAARLAPGLYVVRATSSGGAVASGRLTVVR